MYLSECITARSLMFADGLGLRRSLAQHHDLGSTDFAAAVATCVSDHDPDVAGAFAHDPWIVFVHSPRGAIEGHVSEVMSLQTHLALGVLSLRRLAEVLLG